MLFAMIFTFRHRGLRRFFETGDVRGVNPQWRARLDLRLARLDAAHDVREMDVPGWRLHELHGERAGTWAINVTGNYRLAFRFENGDAYDVDLEDYH